MRICIGLISAVSLKLGSRGDVWSSSTEASTKRVGATPTESRVPCRISLIYSYTHVQGTPHLELLPGIICSSDTGIWACKCIIILRYLRCPAHSAEASPDTQR